MLEKGYNSLDDDFVTVVSKYLLSGDFNQIKEEIRELARKGQVNAIQLWYENNNAGDDFYIDNLVVCLWSGAYDYCLAMARFYDKDEKIKKIENEMLEVYNKSILPSRMNEAKRRIYALNNYHLYDKAVRLVWDACMPEKNGIMLEVLAEYMLKFYERNKVCKFQSEKETAVKYLLLSKKKLNKDYKKNKTSQNGYFLAKSIVELKQIDENFVTEKEVELARNILVNLASRELKNKPEEKE